MEPFYPKASIFGLNIKMFQGKLVWEQKLDVPKSQASVDEGNYFDPGLVSFPEMNHFEAKKVNDTLRRKKCQIFYI